MVDLSEGAARMHELLHYSPSPLYIRHSFVKPWVIK